MTRLHQDAINALYARIDLNEVERNFINRMATLAPNMELTPGRQKWIENMARQKGVIR